MDESRETVKKNDKKRDRKKNKEKKILIEMKRDRNEE